MSSCMLFHLQYCGTPCEFLWQSVLVHSLDLNVTLCFMHVADTVVSERLTVIRLKKCSSSHLCIVCNLGTLYIYIVHTGFPSLYSVATM